MANENEPNYPFIFPFVTIIRAVYQKLPSIHIILRLFTGRYWQSLEDLALARLLFWNY